MNIEQALERVVPVHRDKLAIKCGAAGLSFGELSERVSRFAASLRSLAGVSKGDRIAFIDRGSREYVEFHLAVPKAGLIAVPVNGLLPAQEIRRIVDYAACKVLLYRSSFAPVIEEARHELRSVEHFICLDGPRGDDPGYEDFLSEGPAWRHADPAEDDPAYILFTSGTTGQPKGATLSHRNMLAGMRRLVLALEISPENVFLDVAPLFHVGAIQNVLAFLSQGCTVIIAPGFKPEDSLRLIERERATHLYLGARLLRALLEHPDTERRDLSSLVTVAYGGGPPPSGLISNLIGKWGPLFLQVYGATEAGLIAALGKPAHMSGYASRRPSSCGHPAMGVHLKVAGEGDDDLPPGEAGEILIQSDGVMLGYWDPTSRTVVRNREGWYRTGDMGRIDQDGYLYHVGRKEHVIMVEGQPVYPLEIESVLQEHPDVLETAVLGVPDERGGQQVRAVIVLKQGRRLNRQALMHFCEARLPGRMLPASFELVRELPKNAAGKVQMGALLEQALARRSRRGRSLSTSR